MPNAEIPVDLVQRKILYSGWMTLCLASFRLPDGQIMKREVLEHGYATSVLPYDAARRLALLVRQFRAPVFLEAGRTILLEAIAGMVDDGDAEATARREALEEAGLQLGPLEALATVWPSPGMMTERVALFLAPYSAADRVGAGGGLKEEHEEIEVIEIPLREIAALADQGTLADMKTFALVQSLRLRRPDLFG
ncbi:MAG TPA: NUDIX domain-containing protein [Rhizomicrobium sp.]|nr:NUDIX domain-containing protein [Rhizomicrobium sp.]